MSKEFFASLVEDVAVLAEGGLSETARTRLVRLATKEYIRGYEDGKRERAVAKNILSWINSVSRMLRAR